jgi:hypothetical protein
MNEMIPGGEESRHSDAMRKRLVRKIMIRDAMGSLMTENLHYRVYSEDPCRARLVDSKLPFRPDYPSLDSVILFQCEYPSLMIKIEK